MSDPPFLQFHVWKALFKEIFLDIFRLYATSAFEYFLFGRADARHFGCTLPEYTYWVTALKHKGAACDFIADFAIERTEICKWRLHQFLFQNVRSIFTQATSKFSAQQDLESSLNHVAVSDRNSMWPSVMFMGLVVVAMKREREPASIYFFLSLFLSSSFSGSHLGDAHSEGTRPAHRETICGC